MIKRILVALDGSEHSFKALDLASDVAQKFGADLTLLHVVTSRALPAPLREFLGKEHLHGPPKWAQEQLVGENIVRAAEEKARARGATVGQVIIEDGDPSKVIVEVAERINADLLVMGSRGLSDLEGLILGSVAHKVSHLSHCTVVTVK